MAHVFISYKREDRNIAIDTKRKLEEAGFATWIDENIPSGRKWSDEIDVQIKKSFAMIVILTPESVKSPYVTYEWTFALGGDIQVTPLLFRPIEKFPYRLGDIQYLDFSHEYKWSKLIDDLKQIYDERVSKNDVEPFPLHLKYVLDKIEHSTTMRERSLLLDNLVRESTHPSIPDFLFYLTQNSHFTDIPGHASVKLAKFTNYSDDRAIAPLIETIKNPQHPRQSESAANAIVHYGAKAVEGLRETLSADSSSARIYAIRILGELRISDASGKLKEMIIDDEVTRGDAIEAIGKLEDQSSIPILLKIVSDDNSSLADRMKAIKVLGKFKSREAIPILINIVMSHTYIHLWNTSYSVLCQIENISIQTLTPLLYSDNESIQLNSIALVGTMKNEKFIDALASLLESDNIKMQREVVKALGEIGTPNSFAYLMQMADSSDSDIKSICFYYLGKNKIREAIPKFHNFLKHFYDDENRNYAICGIVIYYLGQIADSSSVQYLRKLIDDTKSFLRFHVEGQQIATTPQKEVIKSLAQIGTPEAQDVLVEWRGQQSNSE